MNEEYATRIDALIKAHPQEIDANVIIQGRVPSIASSEFLTNKEQGDWAEKLVLSAINTASSDYVALPYGRSDSIAAGDPGFPEFYANYIRELNSIGKRPDLLIFRRSDAPVNGIVDVHNEELVSKAVVAIEVRSSSFFSKKYSDFMEKREKEAEEACMRLKGEILTEPYGSILASRKPETFEFLKKATPSTFKELNVGAVKLEFFAGVAFYFRKIKGNTGECQIASKKGFSQHYSKT